MSRASCVACYCTAPVCVCVRVCVRPADWENETYEDRLGWELPAPWVTDIPQFGFLTTTYTSTSAGCCPDINLRREFKKLVLTWL